MEILIAMALIWLITGCAPRYAIQAMRSEADQSLRHRLVANTDLEDPQNPLAPNLSLDLECLDSANGGRKFFLQLTYISPQLLEIEPGPSLSVLLDQEEPWIFQGTGSGHARRSIPTNREPYYIEQSAYAIAGGDLRRLTNARRMTVMVTGRRGMLRREVREETLSNYRRFVQEYVSPEGIR